MTMHMSLYKENSMEANAELMLKNASNFLSTPEKWNQFTRGRFNLDTGCWTKACLMFSTRIGSDGVPMQEFKIDIRDKARVEFLEKINDDFAKLMGFDNMRELVRWNDSSGRLFEEVRALIDKKIAEVESKA
jgi:hypothetical protein